MAATLPQELRSFATTTLQLAQLLGEAQEAQWKPSHVPQPRDDTSERAKGGHGDPTLATVVDDRRLALRAAVIQSEQALETAFATVRQAADRLQLQLDRWAGATEVDGSVYP